MSKLHSRESKRKGDLLCCWVSNGFHVLVPKLRGDGFLRVPYGHHHDSGLSHIAAMAECDVFGLDGSLEFECPPVYGGGQGARDEFATSIIPLLESHYGASARMIHVDEFWALHPVPSRAP